MKLLRIEEVAAMTGVPVNTLRYWRAAGTGPTSAKFGRRIVYREADVENWIDEQFEQAGALMAGNLVPIDILTIADMVGIRITGEELHRLQRNAAHYDWSAEYVELLLRQWQQDARDRSHPAHRDPTAAKALGNLKRA